VPITLTGTGFTTDWPSPDTAQASISVEIVDPAGGSVPGVTVANVAVVNDTTITCDFIISQTAQIGVKQVRVHTDSLESGRSPSGYVEFRVGFPSDFLVFFG
jgi:hypothetical protein